MIYYVNRSVLKNFITPHWNEMVKYDAVNFSRNVYKYGDTIYNSFTPEFEEILNKAIMWEKLNAKI